MNYTIELEKLTDEQLEAFKIIDLTAYNNEKLNRSTYSDEEIKNCQIFTDLDKAYYYLKPMFDNMRNNDTKKTINESGILTTIEKVFRYCKLKGKEYKKFQPVVVNNFETISEAIHKENKPDIITVVSTPEELPVPEVVEAIEPTPVATPTATVVEDHVVIPTTVENMSTAELNKIMESIPAVTKI